MQDVYIGTAAWTIPGDFKELFPEEGSHLERYSRILNSVEINTSFYRDHKASTYERWAQSVPDEFRFAVKVSRVLTHENRLDVNGESLKEKLVPVLQLGGKLGCLLVQLPPSLEFKKKVVERFFDQLRDVFDGAAAVEPRHLSWDSEVASALLKKYKVTQVIADPESYRGAHSNRRDFGGFSYYRLHGSPEMYKSNYETNDLRAYASQMKKDVKRGLHSWCIFDNTTFGFATDNAVSLAKSLGVESRAELSV